MNTDRYNKNMNKIPAVSIIILNYNSWRDCITCIESLFNMNYQNFSVLVVDNESKDSSVENIKDWALGALKHDSVYPNHSIFQSFPAVKKPIELAVLERKELFVRKGKSVNYCREQFEHKFGTVDVKKAKLVLIKNENNLGYAGGNNVGIRYALYYLRCDYVLVLNADTVVSPNLLEKLVKVFKAEKNVGMCGPIEYSYEEPDQLQAAGGIFGLYTGKHRLLDCIADSVKIVDWIMGSCLLIEKGVFFTSGFFDERFFLYFEEIDFAYRVMKNGYTTYVTSETCIWHKGGRKGGRTWDALYDYYLMRNRLLFALKHLNLIQMLIFIPIHLKKLFTFSLRDLAVNKKSNFVKRINAIKEGFVAYNQKIKDYTDIE